MTTRHVVTTYLALKRPEWPIASNYAAGYSDNKFVFTSSGHRLLIESDLLSQNINDCLIRDEDWVSHPMVLLLKLETHRTHYLVQRLNWNPFLTKLLGLPSIRTYVVSTTARCVAIARVLLKD